MPMGKVKEFIKAKFLNSPKLVFSNPKSTKIEPLKNHHNLITQ